MLPLDKIQAQCRGFGLELDSLALERLDRYAELLVEWTEKMNLTAITDPQEMAIKHYLKCL